jgi:hypothetical protein
MDLFKIGKHGMRRMALVAWLTVAAALIAGMCAAEIARADLGLIEHRSWTATGGSSAAELKGQRGSGANDGWLPVNFRNDFWNKLPGSASSAAPANRSGAHPDLVSKLRVVYSEKYPGGDRGAEGWGRPKEKNGNAAWDHRPKRLEVNLPPGFAPDPNAVERPCTESEFKNIKVAPDWVSPGDYEASDYYKNGCPVGSIVGDVKAKSIGVAGPGGWDSGHAVGDLHGLVYLLEAPDNHQGVEAKLGIMFWAIGGTAQRYRGQYRAWCTTQLVTYTARLNVVDGSWSPTSTTSRRTPIAACSPSTRTRALR